LSIRARNSEAGGNVGGGASLEPVRAATPEPATAMADAATTAATTRRLIILIIHLALASQTP
jgi:hypothetical protein